MCTLRGRFIGIKGQSPPPPKKTTSSPTYGHTPGHVGGAEFSCGFCGGLLRMRGRGGGPPAICACSSTLICAWQKFSTFLFPSPYQPFHPPLGVGRATKVNFRLSLLFRIPPPPSFDGNKNRLCSKGLRRNLTQFLYFGKDIRPSN